MGKVIQLYDPLNYVRALHRIKRLWTQGDVEITPHAQQRMAERKISTADIQRVINSGTIREHVQQKVFWRYTVRGKAIDGALMDCVVEVNGHLIIVTVIFPRQTRKGGRTK